MPMKSVSSAHRGNNQQGKHRQACVRHLLLGLLQKHAGARNQRQLDGKPGNMQQKRYDPALALNMDCEAPNVRARLR